MMSQRAHRTKDQTLQTRFVNGVPYVRDDRGLWVAIPAGAAADDGGGGSATAIADKGEEGEEGSEGSGAAGGSEEGQGEYVSRAEHEKVLERMQAADRAKNQKDQELEELRQFKKDMEDKDRSDLERAQNEAEENAQRASSAEERAQAAELKLQMVLANGKRDKPFRDHEDVLRWVDVSDITNDDGELDAKALTKALDSLAENKPYLLAEPASNEEDEEGEEETTTGPSGTSQNKDKNKGKGIDKEALARKYPALRGR